MLLTSTLIRLYAYRTLILLMLLALVAGLAFYLYEAMQQKEEEKQSIINLYARPPVVRTVDTQGRETVRVLAPVIPPAVLAQLKAGFAAEMRDELRKEFRGQAAQLLSAQQARTETKQQLPTVALSDTTVIKTTPAGVTTTTTAKVGTFKDEWLNLTGIVTEDSLSVKYTIRNDFTVRAYSKKDKKHWWQFWKPRKVYVDLKNKNPNTVTTNLESVIVEKK